MGSFFLCSRAFTGMAIGIDPHRVGEGDRGDGPAAGASTQPVIRSVKIAKLGARNTCRAGSSNPGPTGQRQALRAFNAETPAVACSFRLSCFTR